MESRPHETGLTTAAVCLRTQAAHSCFKMRHLSLGRLSQKVMRRKYLTNTHQTQTERCQILTFKYYLLRDKC